MCGFLLPQRKLGTIVGMAATLTARGCSKVFVRFTRYTMILKITRFPFAWLLCIFPKKTWDENGGFGTLTCYRTMKYTIKTLRICSLFIASLLGASLAGAAPEVGKAAPDFTLPGAKGETHTLSDYQGKYVVLEWLNHGCPWVKKHYETGNMQALQKKYGEQGVVWLSVVSSEEGQQGYLSAEQAKETFKSKNVQAADILLDPEGKVGRLYNARVTPEMYVINPEGVLIYMGAMDNDNSQNHDKVKEATNYVAAAIDADKAGKPVEVSATKAYGCTVKYKK